MIAVMRSGDPVYQARYGWSGTSWWLSLGGLAGVSTVLPGSRALLVEILCIPCGTFLLANVVSALIGRPVAFRADESGVTIGGNPIPFWFMGSYANRPVYGGPSGITAGAARVVSMWTLDRNRLEVAVSTFAAGVVVAEIDASACRRSPGSGCT